MEYTIREFNVTKTEEWDDFIFGYSINGTFLQSRRFLNYHPKERFVDASLMVYKKEKLVAVCPACLVIEDGKRVFVSHQGSTYGSFVISKEISRLELLVSLILEFENYIKERGFRKVVLKPTMSLFCNYSDDSFIYALNQAGYKEYKELNLYIDYVACNEDILSMLSKLKKRQVKKCLNAGVKLKELISREEIEAFHRILIENLKKYDKKPIHTVDDLIDLKDNRFPNDIHIYGAYYNDKMVAGTMTFEFFNSSCVHTQYLAALNLDDISPMSFIYYSMMCLYRDKGFKYLSWGIATEHYGEGVNWGLMRNKEEFGSKHCINFIYEKEL